MSININLFKSLIQSNNSNAKEIELLKQSNFVIINEITTSDNNDTVIFKYSYTDYKILTINYNILFYDLNDNIGVFENNIILKHTTNTLIYPKFEYIYVDDNLKNCKINISIDSTFIYINVIGIENTKIFFKGKFIINYY